MGRRIWLLLIAFLLLAPAGMAQERAVTIRNYGHAFFVITAGDGVRIAIDPYGQIGYPMPEVEADVVLVTHEHRDHNNVGLIKGNPRVLRGLAAGATGWNRIYERLGGTLIYGVPSFHDEEQGAKRGLNAIFVIQTTELRIAHLGDLGQPALTEGQMRAMGAVDILLMPVGGFFTIGAPEATRVAAQIRPKVILPMHYKTPPVAALPLADEQAFLVGKENVRRPGSHTLTISKSRLPPAAQIVVLEYR
ncbi:MAG: MBL fold metallo-hydrolase [Armatimonadetes bacterium]|nr:MBL fold metallo-hydrolase [Armatimonadota bacterium]